MFIEHKRTSCYKLTAGSGNATAPWTRVPRTSSKLSAPAYAHNFVHCKIHNQIHHTESIHILVECYALLASVHAKIRSMYNITICTVPVTNILYRKMNALKCRTLGATHFRIFMALISIIMRMRAFRRKMADHTYGRSTGGCWISATEPFQRKPHIFFDLLCLLST